MARSSLDYRQWNAEVRKMIDELPDTGAIIVTFRHDIGRQLMRGIRDRRSLDLANRCRVVVVHRPGDEDALLGVRSSIRLDLSVRHCLEPDHLLRVEQMARDVAATLP